jgi:outer membrane protein assembly factor BamB
MPTWGFAGSVLVRDNRLFVNVGTYGSALDLQGNLIWTTGSEAAGYSSYVPFTMDGREQLAVFGAKAVAAVDPTTGKVQWTHPWKTSYDVNSADPIILGNEVFISSGYGTGAALLRVAGGQPKQVWKGKSVMRNQHNNCVLIDGFLYGFDGDKNSDLKCIEFKTGKERWAQEGLGKGALIAADGKLIINSEKGELVVAAADPAGFKAMARAQILGSKCWTAPVLANGRIYMRNEKGDVACVDVSM